MVPSGHTAGRDQASAEATEWLLGTCGAPEVFFAQLVRKGIDEVLDGPRTGRWDFGQLEKTERTYVGTKLEIMIRSALGLERGETMDLVIAGHEVDVKWSMTSAWQIPEEAHGHLCLCLGGMHLLTAFQVGLVRCRPEYLNLGRNKDRKTTLSKAGREAMTMLVPPSELPQNFVATIDPEVRERVVAHRTIQARVSALMRALPYTPIPREAIRTVARTEGDPIRRLRADAHHGDPFDGFKVLSARYGNAIVRALGRDPLKPDEFMAVPVADIERLPVDVRREPGQD
ncbi:MAG: NaeI family type II restriction endonuclease [Candidatus Limnocylindria bacterium]